jgi:hypothetical protein
LARSRRPSRFSATVLKERLRRTDRTLNQQDRPNCWTLNQQDRPGRGRSPWQPLSKSCRVFIHLPLFSGRFTERGGARNGQCIRERRLQPSRRISHGPHLPRLVTVRMVNHGKRERLQLARADRSAHIVINHHC